MKKKILAVAIAAIMIVTAIASFSLAYLMDTDEAANVMVMGKIDIEQLEYERVLEDSDNDGIFEWVSTGETDKYGYTPDAIQPFNQNKPLYPAVFLDGAIKWDDRVGTKGDAHQQSWAAVGASGSNQLFDDSVKNAIDKFVFVENTGKSDAYVRTIFAFEQGSVAAEEFENVIMLNANNVNGDSGSGHWSWETIAFDVKIGDSTYVVMCATYLGAKSTQDTAKEGILEPGAVSYPSLLQVYMRPEATNEDVEAIDGNGNGTYEILVLSQAVQTNGFVNTTDGLENATRALATAFGDVTAENAAAWLLNLATPKPQN